MIYLDYKNTEIYFWKNGSLWIYYSPDLGCEYHHGTEDLEETMNLVKDWIDGIIEFFKDDNEELPDYIVF